MNLRIALKIVKGQRSATATQWEAAKNKLHKKDLGRRGTFLVPDEPMKHQKKINTKQG